ncbi:aminoglycoside phosphotransferase family protein [Nocardia nova]|uniref:aminoglycoside phosphotransferase family protein n=1 Tax=Nocardia nova TaxID=37330 RepID=UPI0033D51FCB
MSADGALPVLRAACSSAGIEMGEAHPVPFGTALGYRLPSGVVVRISRPGRRAETRHELEAARWLAACGIPTPRAVPGVRQPIEVQGRTVTFWLEPPPHEEGSLGDMATALHRLHRLAPPAGFALEQLRPFLGLSEDIEAAEVFGDDDRRWLRAHLTELRGRWADLPNGLQWCVVHGEAWHEEFADTGDHEVLLLSADNLTIGPPEWDLIPTALAFRSFGWITAADYAGFCNGYGHDVTRWGGFYLLRDIRELLMTLAAARAAAADPQLTPQARWRLSCIRGDQGPRQWPGWEPLP